MKVHKLLVRQAGLAEDSFFGKKYFNIAFCGAMGTGYMRIRGWGNVDCEKCLKIRKKTK